MPEGATSESLSGRVLEGRFRLDEPLGEGGLGVVWRGFHVRLGRGTSFQCRGNHAGSQPLGQHQRIASASAAVGHHAVG